MPKQSPTSGYVPMVIQEAQQGNTKAGSANRPNLGPAEPALQPYDGKQERKTCDDSNSASPGCWNSVRTTRVRRVYHMMLQRIAAQNRCKRPVECKYDDSQRSQKLCVYHGQATEHPARARKKIAAGNQNLGRLHRGQKPCLDSSATPCP